MDLVNAEFLFKNEGTGFVVIEIVEAGEVLVCYRVTETVAREIATAIVDVCGQDVSIDAQLPPGAAES